MHQIPDNSVSSVTQAYVDRTRKGLYICTYLKTVVKQSFPGVQSTWLPARREKIIKNFAKALKESLGNKVNKCRAQIFC